MTRIARHDRSMALPLQDPPPRPEGVTLTNWDLGGERSAWSYVHTGELFPSAEIGAANDGTALEEADVDAIGRFTTSPGVSLDRYVDQEPVDGIVVVWKGRIAYERYPRMRPEQRHLLMSVTKAFVSAVVGILELRGLLDLSRPVDELIPELGEAGWAGVPAAAVLDMASGIDCPENGASGSYDDPGHPFYRYESSLGWRPPVSDPMPTTYQVVAGLPSREPPDVTFEYTSVNTFVLSWLAEHVTGSPFSEVVAREIWDKGAFEAPAQLCVSADGAPVSHAGLSATLRDVARFGLLFTPSSERVTDQEIISTDHVRRIQEPRNPALRRDEAGQPGTVMEAYGSPLPPASRQWDFVTSDGDFYKGGFGGQGLYVSPSRDLVIAFAGSPREDGSVNDLHSHCRRLALALD